MATPANPPSVPQIRVVFMGTPQLSAEILQFLVETGYSIVAVVTQPARAQGRSQEPLPSPVAILAEKHDIPVLTPEKLDASFVDALAAYKPDLIIVAAYGKILPKKILALPGFGCLNIHYSLLPKLRGASPIQNALLSGETETGVTLMLMDEGLDTGPLLKQSPLPIDPHDTTQTLTPKLNTLALALLGETLPLWIERTLEPVPQSQRGATLCQLIERSDGALQWSESAQTLYNRYRAFTPWPGIYCFWKKEQTFFRVKLQEVALPTLASTAPHHLGEVFEQNDEVLVQTGDGALVLKTIQLEGKTSLSIREFLNGNPDFIGALLS